MMRGDDPHDLDRFVRAQEGVYQHAIDELRRGQKRTHWMWFVFPQLAGLGHSAMARRYAITGLSEATAYLRHPVLGARLLECSEAVLAIDHRSAREIFGSPDDIKLRSSATLFARAAGPGSVFQRVLEKYFAAEEDELTVMSLMSAHE